MIYLKKIALNRGFGITDGYFKQKNTMQLHHELKEIRDDLAKQNKQSDFNNTIGATLSSSESTNTHNNNNSSIPKTDENVQQDKHSHPKQP